MMCQADKASAEFIRDMVEKQVLPVQAIFSHFSLAN